MKSSKIKVFYNEKQVNYEVQGSFSKSPLKPKLVVRSINNSSTLKEFFEFKSNFKPFNKSDFKIAHTRRYVDSFFNGGKRAESNEIPWSENLVESVTYTNASLYSAIRHAATNPQDICFSPTSGFHHAQPQRGSGFCTFSGQVIASVKIWREFGMRGAYLDLDGHYGNSIEDSRQYVKQLNSAVPLGFNFNPRGQNKQYLQSLIDFLQCLEVQIENDNIHYVVWCHGADSHEHDDIGGGCNTKYWLECSNVFYNWLYNLEERLGRKIPLILSLFGGYRKDDYQSVINLHLMDLAQCVRTFISYDLKLNLPVKAKKRKNIKWYVQ